MTLSKPITLGQQLAKSCGDGDMMAVLMHFVLKPSNEKLFGDIVNIFGVMSTNVWPRLLVW